MGERIDNRKEKDKDGKRGYEWQKMTKTAKKNRRWINIPFFIIPKASKTQVPTQPKLFYPSWTDNK